MTIEKNIKEFEDLNGFTLPQDFKTHLIDFENFKLVNRIVKSDYNSRSNSSIIDSLFPFDSIHESPFTVKALYNQLSEQFKNYIPIGRDSGGAFFIISTYARHYGHVFFYTMEDDVEVGQMKFAESFDEFIESLEHE